MNEWIVYSLHVAGVCVCGRVGVQKCNRNWEWICLHPRNTFPSSKFDLPKIRFQVENKFQNTSFIQFILWKIPNTMAPCEHWACFACFDSIFRIQHQHHRPPPQHPIHRLGRISNTTTIEYFHKYSRFCLFVYLFFPSQVGNGQKCVISHPFTRAFRQTPKQSTAHQAHIPTKCMCAINKTNSSKKFCCCCFVRQRTNGEKKIHDDDNKYIVYTDWLSCGKTHKSLSVHELFHSLFDAYAKWFLWRKWTPLCHSFSTTITSSFHQAKEM